MKRLIIVLSCLLIFYAGAVWALEGCLDFGMQVHADHHTEASSHHHREVPSAHSHTDPSQIHCPNSLGEFLISSRPFLSSSHGRMHDDIAYDAATATRLSSAVAFAGAEGPPGMVQSKTFPRHLLLSVIRI